MEGRDMLLNGGKEDFFQYGEGSPQKTLLLQVQFPFRKLHIKGGLVSVDLHPVCLAPRAKRTSRGERAAKELFWLGSSMGSVSQRRRMDKSRGETGGGKEADVNI